MYSRPELAEKLYKVMDEISSETETKLTQLRKDAAAPLAPPEYITNKTAKIAVLEEMMVLTREAKAKIKPYDAVSHKPMPIQDGQVAGKQYLDEINLNDFAQRFENSLNKAGRIQSVGMKGMFLDTEIDDPNNPRSSDTYVMLIKFYDKIDAVLPQLVIGDLSVKTDSKYQYIQRVQSSLTTFITDAEKQLVTLKAEEAKAKEKGQGTTFQNKSSKVAILTDALAAAKILAANITNIRADFSNHTGRQIDTASELQQPLTVLAECDAKMKKTASVGTFSFMKTSPTRAMISNLVTDITFPLTQIDANLKVESSPKPKA